MRKVILTCFILCATFMVGLAQDKVVRCYTDEYMNELYKKNPQMQTTEQFEAWLAKKTKERKAKGINQKATYEIPVIVHVIHNGESVGSGNNISAAQVASQIRVLNEDFNRTNADASNTPSNFLSAASSISIEFKLATRDADGGKLAEEGINRVNRNSEGWASFPYATSYVDATVKPATIWDPAKYLNLWVVPLSNSILGYAQFPESTLPGMPSSGENPSTDGVVVLTTAFGSNFDASGNPIASPYNLSGAFNRGRTLTHELGHFLGLRHIWGDGGCGVDDFCTDTPSSDGPNYTGSPCTAGSVISCSTEDMFQNYMDYSDDGCMNLFTADQLDRVETVLLNSPRRNELLSSNTADPILASNVYAAFSTNRTSGVNGVTVSFTNKSFAGASTSIATWTWNFDVDGLGGVSPATFSGENPPTVTFDGSGTFTVRLTVANAGNVSTDTKEVSINVGLIAPTNLTIVNASSTSDPQVADEVQLSWTDAGSDETAFEIIRQPVPGAPVVVGSVGANVTTFTDDTFPDADKAAGSKTYNYRVRAVKGSNTAQSSAKLVTVNFESGVTSIEDELSKKIKLYPNPSALGSVTINLGDTKVKTAQAVIYNAMGQSIQKNTLNNVGDNTLNVERLEKGIYFIQIETDKGLLKKKLIIQ